MGFTCPSTGQRGSTCPSMLLLPGLAARALEEESEAIQVVLVYFAGDNNFLPAAHSLINHSEDVGQERRNELSVCISKAVSLISLLTRALRRQAGHGQGAGGG